MSAFDLWFHDGSGFGWPALETSRQELPQPDHTTKILRNLIVFSGGEKNLAGLGEGANIRLNVPEGLPTEGDTCSHIMWQPGTEQHATMVLNGLEDGARVLDEEAERLRFQLLQVETAKQATELQVAEVKKAHGIKEDA